MPVGGKRHIRYSGTPVATSLDEDAPQRQVIEIALETADFQQSLLMDGGEHVLPIEVLPVPKWREIFELKGSEDELAAQLASLRTDAELAPVVFLRVELGADDVAGTDRLSRFKKVIDEHHPEGRRPIIVEVRERYVDDERGDQTSAERLPPIEELSHLDVFKALYRRYYPGREGPPERLIERFRDIEQMLHDTDEGDR